MTSPSASRLRRRCSESEQRLRLAQQAAKIGAFEWNVQTGVNVWTPELEAMYGLAPGEFGKTQPAWEQLVHPEDRAAAVGLSIRPLKRASRSKENGGSSGAMAACIGSRGVSKRFKDAAGKPLRLTGVNIDITERKQAEEAICDYRTTLSAGHQPDI